MFDVPADAVELLARLQQVAGPLQQCNDFWAGGDWRLQGGYRGEPLLVLVRTYKGRLGSVVFGFPLEGRPIAFSVHDRNTSLIGLRPVPTGDGAFDRRYRVWGWPPELLAVVLDAPTRQWLDAKHDGRDPDICTDEGYLFVRQPLAKRDGLTTLRAVPAPDVLASWLNEALGWAYRTRKAFDDAYAAQVARAGRAGAQAWIEQLVQLGRERKQRQANFRVLVLTAVGVFVLLILLVVALVVSGIGRGH